MNIYPTLNEGILLRCIQIAFEDDDKLVTDYHIIGVSCEDCVDDTYNRILNESKLSNVEWHIVCSNENYIIGFLVLSLEHKILYSFGLNIHNRKKYSQELFEKVCELTENSFSCGLYTKNIRAIEYLLRNGMEIVRLDEDITILKM
jgi:hypothetical protein